MQEVSILFVRLERQHVFIQAIFYLREKLVGISVSVNILIDVGILLI